MKLTILLTGATGYLGSFLVKKLTGQNHKLIVLKRSHSDLQRIQESREFIEFHNLDEVELETVFRDNRIDLILHCATNYGRSQVDPLPLIDANLILPLRLLHLGVAHGVKYFINTDTLLDKRVSHYSLSKKQFLDWLKEYSNRIVCANVALEHFYGPGDDPSKFVSFVISQILNQAPKIDLTPGNQKRDFIFIDDVANAFMSIIDHIVTQERGFHHFEVGSGNDIAIRDFVTMIKRLIGSPSTVLNFGALPYRPNEVMESKVNVEPLKRIGFNTQYSLEQGLLKTIEYERKKFLP